MNEKLRVVQLEDRAVPNAATLEVTVENLAEDGGLFQTPFWVGFHNGRFDLGSPLRRADRFGGLEDLAEEGITAGVSERFAATSDGVDTTILAPGGFAGAPVFDPGESVTEFIEVGDPGQNRFFSFASMIIPSNDAFVANLNAREYRLFNRRGDFLRPLTIDLYGRDVYDSGTEVNDPFGGAAFSAEGGTGVDEGGRIRRSRGLNDFIGTGLPTGEELERAFNAATPIARITVRLAAGPEGSLEADDVTEPTDQTQLTVTLTDPQGVDAASIDPTDLIVVGRRRGGGFFFIQPTAVEVTQDADDPTRAVAVFTLPGPNGEFDQSDNGYYRVFLQADAVEDGIGIGNELQFLGGFTVRV